MAGVFALLPARVWIRGRGSADPVVPLVDSMFDDPQPAKLNSFAKRGPDEVFDPIGTRRGTFQFTISVSEPGLTTVEALAKNRPVLHSQAAVESS